MSSYKDLLAFRKAFALAMKIFEISKRFPKDETYSLQIKSGKAQDRYAPTLSGPSDEKNTMLIS